MHALRVCCALRQVFASAQLDGLRAQLKKQGEVQTATMTNKKIGQDLLDLGPDDALGDTTRELEFIAAVRQRLSELDNGDSISH